MPASSIYSMHTCMMLIISSWWIPGRRWHERSLACYISVGVARPSVAASPPHTLPPTFLFKSLSLNKVPSKTSAKIIDDLFGQNKKRVARSDTRGCHVWGRAALMNRCGMEPKTRTSCTQKEVWLCHSSWGPDSSGHRIISGPALPRACWRFCARVRYGCTWVVKHQAPGVRQQLGHMQSQQALNNTRVQTARGRPR